MQFLTSALDGGQWSASHIRCFVPKERIPSIQCIGGWVAPSSDLDDLEKREISYPCQD
jgi:hypothetical protein